jgi:CHAT domain-containing protein/Tfp pilus assembly protein PilF
VVLVLVTAAACNREPIQSTDALYRNAKASFEKGDIKIALDRAELGFRTCGHSIDWCWKFQLLKAESLMALAQSNTALELLEGAENPPNPELQARRHMDEGWALYSLSDYSRAVKLLEEAHHLAETSNSPLLVAEVELRQAPLLQRVRRFDEADASLRHALELATRAGDSYVQALATGNLGFLFLNGLSRYDEAIYWFEKSLTLSELIGAPALTAQTMGNVGECYYQLGDFEKALASFGEAESRFARVGNTRWQAVYLGDSGNIFFDSGDFSAAIDRYSRALEMARRIEDKAHTIDWLTSLARANLGIGQLDTAEAFNKEGQALTEATGEKRKELYLRLNFAKIAERRKKFEQAERLYESLVDPTSEDPTPTIEAQEGLAGLYIETGEPQKAEAQFQSAIATIESRQTGLTKEEYKLSYLSSLVRFYRSYVDFLVQRGETGKALEVVESSRARILKERVTNVAAPTSLSPSQLQALARSSRRVLLSYWLAPKQSYVWAITPTNIQMFTLPPEKEIRGLVESYRTVIEDLRDPLESQNPAGMRLAEILIGPIREITRPGSHVVIVPDGALHSLNFATLPTPGDTQKYWIEDVTLAVAPSLGLALNSHSARKPQRASLLAIGDPESAGEEFPRLPNARKEVDTIAALFSNSNRAVYEGAESQPSIYRRANPAQFSFIHFAAHATANRASPLDSALILSREGNMYALTAREIMKIPLGASVVTLSSCRSAGARAYSGEGLVGLTWAFLQSGAQSVVAGLWDVDDESTSRMMSRMYSDLTRGVPPDDALRAAQLSLLHAEHPYKKPYYWGPFQLYSGTKRR